MPKDNLSGKNLDHVNLSGTDLSESDLSNTSLRRSQLKGAKLHNANLAESDLRGAHLEHADLTGAHLERANLTGTDLRGVDLSRVASLEGARLGGARGVPDQTDAQVDDDQVISVRWDAEWPEPPLASVAEINRQIIESLRAASTEIEQLTGKDRRDAIDEVNHLRQRRDAMEAQLVRALMDETS